MEEQSKTNVTDREINLGEFLIFFPKIWWIAGLISLTVGAITLLYMLQMPNVYQATAIITPVLEEGKPSPSLSLGALASVGISLGGPTKVEDLEALFRSNDLTARVFQKYDIWRDVLGRKFDKSSRTIKPSLWDRLSGNEKAARAPGDWDAIRAARKSLKIYSNKKAGTLVLSMDTHSAEGSAKLVKYYLEEGKDRLQEEAFERASRNKEFIKQQIAKAVDPLSRDRLYSLYGQEVEREMMARNREQFGFKIIDSPRVPDRKWKPHRALITFLAAALAFLVSYIFFAVWWEKRPTATTSH